MYVYFIKAGKFLKIGISEDPERRLSQLQTGSPMKLTLSETVKVRTEREAKDVECAMHLHFRGSRIHGEWFKGVSPKRAVKVCRDMIYPKGSRGAFSTYRVAKYVLSFCFLALLFFYIKVIYWV